MQASLKKKICMIGAFAVGKTSLVQQYVFSIFSEKYHTTVGVKIDKKHVSVNGQDLDLIIWDLHGEDEFQSVRMSYLRGASGFIYVVDGTRRATLDTALRLRRQAETVIGKAPSILAVNKCDMMDVWEIDTHSLQELASEDLLVIQTSAKTGHSVNAAFSKLAGRMIEVGA